MDKTLQNLECRTLMQTPPDFPKNIAQNSPKHAISSGRFIFSGDGAQPPSQAPFLMTPVLARPQCNKSFRHLLGAPCINHLTYLLTYLLHWLHQSSPTHNHGSASVSSSSSDQIYAWFECILERLSTPRKTTRESPHKCNQNRTGDSHSQVHYVNKYTFVKFFWILANLYIFGIIRAWGIQKLMLAFAPTPLRPPFWIFKMPAVKYVFCDIWASSKLRNLTV